MRDRNERRHRRTAKNLGSIEIMAEANFDAEPSLAEAMGLEDSDLSIPLEQLQAGPPNDYPVNPVDDNDVPF